jgi:hypothetical protein
VRGIFLGPWLASQKTEEKALTSTVPVKENSCLVSRYNVGLQGNLQQFTGLDRGSIGDFEVPFVGG